MSAARQIVVITLDGQRIDCKVQGSELSVRQYAEALALATRGVADIFSNNSAADRQKITEALLVIIEREARIDGGAAEVHTLQ